MWILTKHFDEWLMSIEIKDPLFKIQIPHQNPNFVCTEFSYLEILNFVNAIILPWFNAKLQNLLRVFYSRPISFTIPITQCQPKMYPWTRIPRPRSPCMRDQNNNRNIPQSVKHYVCPRLNRPTHTPNAATLSLSVWSMFPPILVHKYTHILGHHVMHYQKLVN